jgi:four helix bundle protein
MDLVERIYDSCRKGALSKDWGYRGNHSDRRFWVPASIAEGYERRRRREYVQYLTIARGSVGELRCRLRLASRLGYIDETSVKGLILDALEISRMLKGLSDSIEKR